MKQIANCLAILFFAVSCSSSKPSSQASFPKPSTPVSPTKPISDTMDILDPNESFFNDLFAKNPNAFKEITTHRKKYNVQVIFTQITRDEKNYPTLKNYTFNQTNPDYFYPASTVKFPIALLVMQKINELQAKGIRISLESTMVTDAEFSGQTPVYNDPNTPDGKPSLAQYLKRVFEVSDNDAANRLYEFLGLDYINTELQKRGFSSADIHHRFDIYLSEEENRNTNPIRFFDSTGKLVYTQPNTRASKPFAKRNDLVGQGYYSKGKLIQKPMDFSSKNRISLEDLNLMMQGLIFPEKIVASKRFNITREQTNFLLKYMSQLPRESVYPFYNAKEFPDNYTKFIFMGNDKKTLPDHIRIFNKSGNAYGQLIDNIYFVDFKEKIEFILTATIYANNDGILNDDKYDYNTVGLPFLKNLGEAIYQYELKRKKPHSPILTDFIFNYDK